MKIILTISIIFLGFLYTQAQTQEEWVVPDEDAAVLSPFKFSDDDVKAGEQLYQLNCKSCHGDPGQNNYIELNPPPGDITTDKIQHNSDGAIHYKIMNGRGPMPSFANVLSPTQKWQVIAFIRKFNDAYVQEVAEVIPESAFGGEIEIDIEYLESEDKLQTSIIGLKDNEEEPIAGAELNLFAQRNFGKLPLDQVRKTDKEGNAVFNLPADLPGDSSGFVKIHIAFVNQELYGETFNDTALAFGIPTYKPPLNEQRAMWNVRTKAPIWLLIAFNGSVITVYGIILYILLMIRKIYFEGKKKEEE